MYINFWYPMALAEEIAEEPVRVQALGQEFVLFRDTDGKYGCLADVCLHRGGSLAGGKVKDDCVECPYHGWRFDRSGVCQLIPTLADDAKIPARARLDSYPVIERYGVVFAFLGDLPEAERPELTPIPQWDQEGWSVTHLVYDWQANFERVIENGLDATHTEFVHPSAGLQGSFKPGEHLQNEMVESRWGSALRTNSPDLEIEHGHSGPSCQWTFLRFAMGEMTGNFLFYSYVRPLNESSVRRFLFHARDFQLGEEMDRQMVETTFGFEAEDREVIERMRPLYSPRGKTDEMLLPEDQIMVRFREHLAAWDALGWRIDSAALAADGGRTAFAVPCPARRSAKSWVRQAVPLETGGR